MQNDQSCRKGIFSTFYSSINVQENNNCSAARLLHIYIGGHSDIPPLTLHCGLVEVVDTVISPLAFTHCFSFVESVRDASTDARHVT